MKIKIGFFLVLILLLFPYDSYSTHIVGGEINYIYLGNNIYEIHVKVYRDCYNGVPPFDNPAAFGIFDSSNNLFNYLSVNYSSFNSITNSPNNCMPVAPGNICYEVANYQFNANFPPVHGGYQIAYQRCCRSTILTNVVNPDSSGITLYATIPDSLFSENSSPVFNNVPFTFLCENIPFTFNDAATDADRDSLVYSLCTPLLGGSTSTPAPDPPGIPPYDTILWLPPYSLSNLMGGLPLSINPQTGLLSGTPNSTGVFDYAVCVKEYRNGIYLGETRRDFQATVITNIGIEEFSFDKFITCYPNPFNTTTTFRLNPGLFLDNAALIIYNMLGKEVGNIKNITTTEFSFDRNNIANGIYCFKFFNTGKLTGVGKIILHD